MDSGSEIGETRDAKRFDIQQNDLAVASNLFNMFKGAKNIFESTDKRCKVVNINKFIDSDSWSVDRWWTKDEKIEIGIEENVNAISIEDFISLIDDLSSSLLEYEEPLKQIASFNSRISFKSASLSEIFDFSITTNSSKFTKTFINNNKGEIPVYGASKNIEDVSYGYIKDNIDGVKYFSDCLTWNIDGSIGLFYRSGRFSLSEKVIPLILKQPYIGKLDLDFLRYTILTEVQKNPFTYTNKGGKTRLGKITISVPIDKNGDYDIDAQRMIAEKYKAIEQYKNEVKARLDILYNQNVSI